MMTMTATKRMSVKDMISDNSYLNNNTQSTVDPKQDKGKPHPSYVPVEIIKAVMDVREFAVNGKYPDPRNWMTVSVDRYHDAMLRHVLACWEDPFSVDEESGLLHLSHIATNVAFMLALHAEEGKEEKDSWKNESESGVT